jgi:uncharacterized NAD(P)/FAD-binding protein YdhS
MSFKDILNKNNKKFETKSKVDNKSIDNIVYYNPELKDYDEEFDRIYDLKVYDLRFDFGEFIKDQCLPFLDKTHNFNYSFYDFIKNNSENYLEIIEIVDKDNEIYLKELEEEEEKYMLESHEND